MDADDRIGPRQWTTMSPEHFDWLARAVLRAARDAARELRREPPDSDRRTWALGKLAGQIQAMLGPDLPDHPPAGAAAQEEFVRAALALAVHVRAHSWAMADLGPLGVLGQADVPHPGESRAADPFDVLGRLMLPHSSPEGWTATLVTDLARGDGTLEAVVKVGKYILHPTFLALTDDATRVVGEALHNLNVRRLNELTRSLRNYAGVTGPPPPKVPLVTPPPVAETMSDERGISGPHPVPQVPTVAEKVSDEPVSGPHPVPRAHSDGGETPVNRTPLADDPDGSGIDISEADDPGRRDPPPFGR